MPLLDECRVVVTFRPAAQFQQSRSYHGHSSYVYGYNMNRKNFPYCRRIERYYLVTWTEFSMFFSAVTCNDERYIYLKCEGLKIFVSSFEKALNIRKACHSNMGGKKNTSLQTYNRPKNNKWRTNP